ncbi:MAG: DNA gyrase subunit A [Dysosmobacter sp.]
MKRTPWTGTPTSTRPGRSPGSFPARFPNLLVNGSSGIAVGMATNIPPHNLREVIGACICVLDDPEATSGDLMEHVKGPDFPTKGIIMGRVRHPGRLRHRPGPDRGPGPHGV